MIPIVFLFYKTKTFKDYHSYEMVHEKWIKIDLEKWFTNPINPNYK